MGPPEIFAVYFYWNHWALPFGVSFSSAWSYFNFSIGPIVLSLNWSEETMQRWRDRRGISSPPAADSKGE